MKWNMGWMNDTLRYFALDPIHRQYHHNELTFSMLYAFHENFVLPLSHDEVVHGKRSLLEKMPGDDWQKFANLRLLFGYMYAHPGKKLLFMGSELGQRDEFWEGGSVEWSLENSPPHRGIQRLVADLNRLHTARARAPRSGFRVARLRVDRRERRRRRACSPSCAAPGTATTSSSSSATSRRWSARIIASAFPRPGFYREILNTDSELLRRHRRRQRRRRPRRAHPLERPPVLDQAAPPAAGRHVLQAPARHVVC